MKSCLEEKIEETSIQNSVRSKLEYLKILDTYGISWSIEKTASDALQNFFDANNKTLDDIDIKIHNEKDDYTIKIIGKDEYDFRRLTHLGGTTKANDRF